MRNTLAITLALCGLALPALADSENSNSPKTSSAAPVLKCDGTTDNAAALQALINKASSYDTVSIPAGKCVIGQTITISKPVSIVGVGRASQIFETANKTLFDLQNVKSSGENVVTIKDLYLGSLATTEKTALIKLTNTQGVLVDNITMLGGYYGVHIAGSSSNKFVSVRSGTNFRNILFNEALASTNQAWIFAEPANGKSSNDNTFIGAELEGGTNGLILSDLSGQGGITMMGGTIEGVEQVGLAITGTTTASTITGLHMEANLGADVVIQDASNIKFTGLLAVSPARAATRIGIQGKSSNISITDSMIDSLTIETGPGGVQTPTTASNIYIQNVTACVSDGFNITPPAKGDPNFGMPNGITYPTLSDNSLRMDIVYSNLGFSCGGQ